MKRTESLNHTHQSIHAAHPRDKSPQAFQGGNKGLEDTGMTPQRMNKSPSSNNIELYR